MLHHPLRRSRAVNSSVLYSQVVFRPVVRSLMPSSTSNFAHPFSWLISAQRMPVGLELRALGLPGRVVEDDHRLEHRRLAEVALGVGGPHDRLVGHVGVREGLERRLARAPDQLVERRVAGQVEAQRQRVDEVADHRLELGAVAAGERRADDDVVLAGVARRAACRRSPAGRRTASRRCAARRRAAPRAWRCRASRSCCRRPRSAPAGAGSRSAGPAATARRPSLRFQYSSCASAMPPSSQRALPDRVVGVLDRAAARAARARPSPNAS